MRLLMVSNHGDIIGGGELSLVDLGTRLPALWRPLVVVPADGAVARRFRSAGVPVHVIGLPPLRPWRAQAMATAVLRLGRLVREKGIDLIHANGSRAAFYGGMAGRWKGIPVLFHCRIDQPDPWLDPILARLVTAVVANSRATAGRFAGRAALPVTVVHNGIDLTAFAPATTAPPTTPYPDGDWVVAVARLSRWKRHDLILRAFADAAARFPRLRLALVGGPDRLDPGWEDALRDQAEALDCHDRIHWIGAVDDVRPWYHMAKLLVHAADSEPFGRVVVEAMAMGVPIVATAAGGIPEVIGQSDAGLLSPPGDADALARSITAILTDSDLAVRMAEAGRVRAQSFALVHHVERMTDVFSMTTGLQPHARGAV